VVADEDEVGREEDARDVCQETFLRAFRALHGFRGQADQWVAAALFPVSMFASFSIATVIAPMVQLFRQSVNHVFLPSMSRSHSSGDVAAMLGLNSRANAIVALLVYPLLAFAFVFAEPLIAFIYTPAYLDAVPVMRLYIVALVAFVAGGKGVLAVLGRGVGDAAGSALWNLVKTAGVVVELAFQAAQP